MRTHIKSIVAKGKIDSSSYNELIEDAVTDLYNMRLDIDELLATAKSNYILSDINTVAQNNDIENIQSLLTESLLKPRYSIIRPYITRNAPLIGGNSYNITSLSSTIFTDFGIISPPILSTTSKIPSPESATYELDYEDLAGIIIGKPFLAIRNTGWIASMDETDRTDITLTINIDQNSVTNLSSNIIEVIPLRNTSISSISIITSGGTEQIVATNVNRNALIPFTTQDITGIKLFFSADDCITHDGRAYIGLKHVDVKKNTYGDTGIFQIDFVEPTSIVSVDVYLQSFDNDLELIDSISSEADNITYEFVSNSIVIRFGILDSETGIPRLIRYIKAKR